MSDEDPNDDRTSGSEDIPDEELLESDEASSRPSSAAPPQEQWGEGGSGSGAGLNGDSSFVDDFRPIGFGRREKQPPVNIKGFSDDLRAKLVGHAYLRGMLERNASGDHVFKGQWSLGFESFYDPLDVRSDFEFKHKAMDADETEIFPLAGKYEGWYKLKEGSGVKKHDDKELFLTFTPNSVPDSYNVGGYGRNEYGQYTITGLVTDLVGKTATLEIFRVYDAAPVAQPVESSKGAAMPKRVPKTPGAQGDGPSAFSNFPVDGGRTRPKPAGGVGKIDAKRKIVNMGAAKPTRLPGGGGAALGQGMANSVAAQQLAKIISEKQASRCRTIIKALRDSVKVAVSWFEKPVNELLAPNYRQIIQQPMDLSTIEGKLRKRTYPSISEFVQDMRLIFRNAMTYNAEGEPCYSDAVTCSKTFEEIWKKHCVDLRIAYDDGGAADDVPAGGRLAANKPKAKQFTNVVGPRPLPSAGAGLVGGGLGLSQALSGGAVSDAVQEYRQQLQELTRNLMQSDMDKAKLQMELDMAKVYIRELEEKLGVGPRPGMMPGDLMMRGGGNTAAAAAGAAPPKAAEDASMTAMREDLKQWVSRLSEIPEYGEYAEPFVQLIQSLGIDCFEPDSDEVTIDVDAYSEDVIVTLHNYVQGLSQPGAEEAAPQSEEMQQAEETSSSPNGQEEAGAGAAAKTQGRVKRPRSGSEDDDDDGTAMVLEEEETAAADAGEGPQTKKRKEDAEEVAPPASKEEPKPTAEADGDKEKSAMEVEGKQAEDEEEEEEEAPAAEEEEEEEVSGENAMARWVVDKGAKGEADGEAKEGGAAEGEEGKAAAEGGAEGDEGSDLWDQARREKEEELRRAEEKKRQDAIQEKIIRQQKEEKAKQMLEAQEQAARERKEEEERAAREAEEAKKEEEAKKKQAMEQAREEARLKRLNMMA